MATKCWAESLRDCEGSISLEHYVSECIFRDREVKVKGFPWCKGEFKSVRIETLGRNMLCVKHNSELSPVDASMIRVIDELEKSAALLDVRRNMLCRHWNVVRFSINSRLLERWCLKTLINVAYGRELDVNLSYSGLSIPVAELVRVAFGKSEFEKPAGLYMQASNGDTISLSEGLQIKTTTSDKGELVGGQFNLFGYPFVLSILPSAIAATDWSNLLHRDVKMIYQTKDDKNRDVRSHELRLVWK